MQDHVPYVENAGKEKAKANSLTNIGLNLLKTLCVFVLAQLTTMTFAFVFGYVFNTLLVPRFAELPALTFKDALACVLLIITAMLPLSTHLMFKELRESALKKGGMLSGDATNWAMWKAVITIFFLHPMCIAITWLWSLFLN